MVFNVLTIFPEMFKPFWEHGIVRRAIESGIIAGFTTNIRDFAEGRHKVTDDRPYGGGSGMIMKPEPLAAAIRAVRKQVPDSKTVLLSPQGSVFNQNTAREFAQLKGLILVCGRYEGVDERICLNYIDEEISIGDFVLTGGELAAMVLMDAVTRMIPGALGGENAANQDSFAEDRLEHAHYTRPQNFEDEQVPSVLLSGDHQAIDRWRIETALKRTFLKRKDLLLKRPLSTEEKEILRQWCFEIQKIICAESVHGIDALPGDQ